MKILVLAPQPFLEERGTPIAVDLIVRSLGERGHTVSLLTYHLGRDVHYAGMTLHRIPRIPFIRRVRPGFSMAKVICDLAMWVKAWSLVRRERPDVVHAVEESVFIAWWLQITKGIPYIYDMDSSLPDQLVDSLPLLRPARPLMMRLLQPVVCAAMMVTPVCEALAKSVESFGPQRVVVLRDVSLLSEDRHPARRGMV